MIEALIDILLYTQVFAIGYFILVNTTYFVLLVSASTQLWWYRKASWGRDFSQLMGSSYVPRISVLAPAYNEEATVVESVRGHLTLHYPNLEVVVTNDGSKDGTFQRLMEEFDLEPIPPLFAGEVPTDEIMGSYRSKRHPELLVIDKKNGGKADALNACLNASTGDLVCSIDADTIIDPDALVRMVQPFVTRRDVIASGGTIRPANGSEVTYGRVTGISMPKSWLALFQTVEYARAFLFGRLGWNMLGGNLIISGAFGLFNRAAMAAAGGYERASIGEDMELIVRLKRQAIESGQAARVAFLPDPVAWTEVPESLRVLGRQRDRWHRGLADVLCRHRKVLFNPRYGSMGMIGFPYYFLIELLAPVIETLGLAALGLSIGLNAVNVEIAILLLLLAYGYGLVLTLATLAMEESAYGQGTRSRALARRLFCVLVENFGYRQITVYWRVRGLVKFFKGQHEWGEMTRRGFQRESGAG